MGMLAAHIRGLRKNAGLTQAQLALRIGVGTTTINNIESGYITSPAPAIIDALAAAFSTDSYSLINRLSIDVGERAKLVHVVSSISSKKPFVEIDKIVETAFIDREDLHGFEYMGLKMPDNSMVLEAIKEGASVIIRKDAIIQSGDIVAAVYNDNDAVIRTYYKDGNTVVLKAASNPDLYPDIVLDLEKDRFIIIGKVVHCTNYFGKNK
ncbi:MAG: helix-turn-helix domain-containing protein [Clostridia bacterium]|nr:helix-turn-helix domain-containing protein [Clostridia bacterium]